MLVVGVVCHIPAQWAYSIHHCLSEGLHWDQPWPWCVAAHHEGGQSRVARTLSASTFALMILPRKEVEERKQSGYERLEKRTWCGDREQGGKAIDVGKMCILHRAALCLQAVWSHCN